MADDVLLQSLRKCCVQVMGARPGAGFFVAPRFVVTCAHVLGSVQPGASVLLRRWSGPTIEEFGATTLAVDTEHDIAVLKSGVASPIHAPLGTNTSLGDLLVGVGFPKRGEREEFDQFTAFYEGETWFRTSAATEAVAEEKFKAGQVEPGFSGGPLLNLATGEIFGMTIATRDRMQALGGWAIRVNQLRQSLQAADVHPEPCAAWPQRKPRATVPNAPFQAPILPRHYVERSDLLERLLASYSPGEEDASGPAIIALHGAGGIGKTTLAAAIARHPQIRAQFPDGVLWTELGLDPQTGPKLNAWATAFAGASASDLSEDACIGLLRTALHGKACLLVIDNVWDAAHLEPFLVGGLRCVMLFTTRRVSIADEVGASPIPVGDLTPAQSVELVRRRAPGLDWGQSKTFDAVTQLVSRVDGIALAVELIGSLLNRGISVEEVGRHLVPPTGAGVATSTMRTLEQCFALSISFLRREDPTTWERFLYLGLTPSGAHVNADCCATLWDTEHSDAQRSLWRLADDALVSRVGHIFRLHDLIRDLALRHVERASGDGLGASPVALHAQIVERYAVRAAEGAWERLASDDYVHANLFWHVQQSADPRLASRILRARGPDGQLSWYLAREQRGERAGYVADVRLALRMFAAQGRDGVSSQIFCALVLASLRSVTANLSPRVFEALVAHGAWSALTGFFGILGHELSDHSVRLLIAFAQGLDRRTDVDRGGQEIVARLRSQALKISQDELMQRVWSVRTGNLLGQLIALLPSEEGEQIATTAMSKLTDLEHRVLFLGHVPPHRRSAFSPAIETEISKLAPLETRIQMMSRFLVNVDRARQGAASQRLVDWLDELLRANLSRGIKQEGKSFKVGFRNLEFSSPVFQDGEPITEDRVKDEYLVKRARLRSSVPVIVKQSDDNEPEIAVSQVESGSVAALGYEFMHDLSKSFPFLSKQQMKDVEALLAVSKIDSLARGPLLELRYLLNLSEIKATEPSGTTFTRALERGHLLSALRAIDPNSTAAEADFEAVLGLVVDWRGGEDIAANWLPTWLKLEQGARAHTAQRLAAIFPNGVGPQAMLIASREPIESDYAHLAELIRKLPTDKRETAQYVCVSVGNERIAQLALAGLAPIDDGEDQAGAVIALMPFLPRDFPPDLLDLWQNSSIAGTRSATLISVMSELIHAIAAGALVDVLESSIKRESEWWLVEALTSTLRRLQSVEEFQSMLDAALHIVAFDLRVRLVSRVAQRAADFGHCALALATIQYIVDGPIRWDHARELAQHFASIGDFVSARVAAGEISSSTERSHAFALVAIELAAQGHWRAADEVVTQNVVDQIWIEHVQQLLARRSLSEKTAHNSLATTRARERRVIEPSPSDIQTALVLVGKNMGDSNSLSRLQNEIQKSDLENVREQAVAFWTQPVASGQLAAEFLAMQPRPVLLKRLGELAPLIGIVSAETVTETITAIGDCATNWR